MKVSDVFQSRFLKAADLGGKPRRVVIAKIGLEEFEAQHKPTLAFIGTEKELVLNKINASLLAQALGDEMENWIGRAIELRAEPVLFQGRTVDAIRVSVPVPPKAAPQANNAFADMDDDVPA